MAKKKKTTKKKKKTYNKKPAKKKPVKKKKVKKKKVKKKVTVKKKATPKKSKTSQSKPEAADNSQARWGDMKFDVSQNIINPITDLKIEKSISIDEESSKLEYSPAKIDLDTTLVAELGNDIIYQYKKWCSFLKKYKYLYVGGKKVWDVPAILQSVSVDSQVIDSNGRLRVVKLSLTFEEWDAKQRESVYKKWKSSQNTSSSSTSAKKKTIKKGSKVKITAKTYYGGKPKISAAVRKKTYKVKKISGNKVYLVGLKKPVSKSKLSLVGTTSKSSSVKGSGLGTRIAKAALGKRGCKYVWGATGPKTFDCSGLVWWAHKQCGVSFGRTNTKGLSKMGKNIAFSKMKPGDILIFSNNRAYSGIHHTGIYIGSGKMVHAPHTGSVVQTVKVTSGYYKKQFYNARRLY